MNSDSLSLYEQGQSWLHKGHPFNKMIYIVLTGVVVYTLPFGWIPAAIMTLVNVLIGTLNGQLPRLWKYGWRTLLPLAVFMLPIHAFLYPGNHTPLFILPFGTIYHEGVLFAIKVLLQLSAILTASLLFVFTTHPADLVCALTKAGLPPVFGYLLSSPLLMLPAMQARARAIMAAQRARGLDSEGSVVKRVRAIAPLIGPLILGAFAEIEQRAIALELRGFTLPCTKTSLREVADSPTQRVLRWGMGVLVILIPLTILLIRHAHI